MNDLNAWNGMSWHVLIDAMQDVERTKKIPSNASETKGRNFRISVWFCVKFCNLNKRMYFI